MASFLQEPVGMLLSRTTPYNIECITLSAIKINVFKYIYYIYFIFLYCVSYYTLTGNICGIRFTIILNRVTSSVETSIEMSSADMTFVTKSSIMEFVIHPKMLKN